MMVAPLGFGGAESGFGEMSREDVDRLLNSVLDTGINVVDTAECYGDGEEKIGRAIAHRRDEFHLFSKCGHSSGIDIPDWDPKLLEQSIDRSLQRLKTDRIDLMQLHSCSEEILRQGSVIEVLQRAKEAGKVRFIGYSGDTRHALYAIQTGAFDALQTSVNIADQECIDLTLPEAERRGMGVIAKRPVANVAWYPKPEHGGYEKDYTERLKELDYEFLKQPLQEAVGIALRFTLSQPVHVAIVGTTKPERLSANAADTEKGPLSPEQIETIRHRWKDVSPLDWVGQE
jgi:aryl-alcohol dehydrogenase-like predicted oxidoreductase